MANGQKNQDNLPDDIAAEQMHADEERLLDELGIFGESRRQFLGQMSAAGLSVLAMQILAEQTALAASGGTVISAAVAEENAVAVKLKINGAERTLNLDSRV